MVDSNDRDRVVEARDELHRMLNEVNHYIFSDRTVGDDVAPVSEHCICNCLVLGLEILY